MALDLRTHEMTQLQARLHEGFDQQARQRDATNHRVRSGTLRLEQLREETRRLAQELEKKERLLQQESAAVEQLRMTHDAINQTITSASEDEKAASVNKERHLNEYVQGLHGLTSHLYEHAFDPERDSFFRDLTQLMLRQEGEFQALSNLNHLDMMRIGCEQRFAAVVDAATALEKHVKW